MLTWGMCPPPLPPVVICVAVCYCVSCLVNNMVVLNYLYCAVLETQSKNEGSRKHFFSYLRHVDTPLTFDCGA